MATDAADALAQRPYYDVDGVQLTDLADLTATRTPAGRYAHAITVEDEVVIYDMASLQPVIATATGRRAVMAELAEVLGDGPGVLCLRAAVPADVVDRATAAFLAMIEAQHASGSGAGDHFARAGANDRVWNALEKLAVEAPDVFVDYYASDGLALASAAWLGPAYQITSQLNLVRPGGAAQSAHRDYPLGFMTDPQATDYPAHTHTMTPLLTLQGAVAHVDMPVESGPTKLLPHSHKLADGYLAWRRPDVRDLFESQAVQLPLSSGDAVFFNPALLHAAGENRTADVHRLANLLQVVSPFARAMETIDRSRMTIAIYPSLLERRSQGWTVDALEPVIAAAAEGYPFPTNLDLDPPIDGLAPASQADLLRCALRETWTPERLGTELDRSAARRRTT
jgi:ectoine hydroxylase-related dioxygenase (phytanoyl-CoA dioxygenase family)